MANASGNVTPCPSRARLTEYADGRLSDDLLDVVADHVSGCSRCEEVLGQLADADNTVVSRLRLCVWDEPLVREPECAELEARARALRPEELAEPSSSAPGEAAGETLEEERFSPRPFGQYELLAPLGRGGMGAVYKARHVALNRLVAIKMVLAGAHAGPQDRARFRTEGKAIARLRHPNVVQIYDFAEHDGVPYFSMEFVEGGSLARHLAGGQLPEREAAELVQTLARAVHAAHGAGVVHRDLKPANILLSFSCEPRASAGSALARGSQLNECVPKISDFGLAKLLDADDSQTRTEAVVGTPAYMAPEQAAGRNRDIGPPVDVYALGAILYELLTGRRPFRGATRQETLDQVRNEGPTPPVHWRPRLSRDLEAICLKCLEKEPARRYDSAQALADDLDCWLRGETTHARPACWPARAWSAVRRRPWLSVTAAACALTVLLTAAAAHFRDQRRPLREKEPDQAVRALEGQLAQGEAVTLIGETGPPGWSRWSLGQGGILDSASRPGTFYLHGIDPSLLELVPPPLPESYLVRAEIFVDQVSNGRTGIHFAHGTRVTDRGTEHCYCELAIVQGGEEPCRVDLNLCRHRGREKGSGFDFEGGLRAKLLRNQPEKEYRWHSMAVRVTPEQVEAFFDNESLGVVPRAQFAKTARVPARVNVDPTPNVEPDLRGGLGLVVNRAGASFRRVVLQPIR